MMVTENRDISSWWTNRRALIAGAALLVAALAAWFMLGARAEPQESKESLPPVFVEAARRGPIDVQVKALGTVTPLATVSVRSRVDGELTHLYFDEGQHVAKGQLLAQIDPRPYRAALAQAQGDRQQTAAQLMQARRELEQQSELRERGFATRTKVNQQEALVEQYGGAIATGDGRIAESRLQLAFTQIRAPISGRIGLRGVDQGNLVRSGDDSVIAVITQTRPISALFTIPETRIDEIRAAMKSGGVLRVEAWDRGERAMLASGTIGTLDNRIDTASGTLRLRGIFANADERLFPNQFVNVRLRLRTVADAVTVPSAAVQHGVKGPFAYVVDGKGLARKRDLVLGVSDESRTQIVKGLSVGDRVVLEGFDRVKDGEKVEIIAAPKAP